MDLKNPERILKKDPTPKELQEIDRLVDLSGRGDFVHDVRNSFTLLHTVMESATESGWNDKLRETWRENCEIISQLLIRTNKEKNEEKILTHDQPSEDLIETI